MSTTSASSGVVSVRRTTVSDTVTVDDGSASSDISVAPREDRHLRRRPDVHIYRPHRRKAHDIAEPLGESVGPLLELRACPLEPVIAVPKAPRRQGLPTYVVLHIGRRDHNHSRPSELEHHPPERGQTR